MILGGTWILWRRNGPVSVLYGLFRFNNGYASLILATANLSRIIVFN